VLFEQRLVSGKASFGEALVYIEERMLTLKELGGDIEAYIEMVCISWERDVDKTGKSTAQLRNKLRDLAALM
jgi:hypothetical protein